MWPLCKLHIKDAIFPAYYMANELVNGRPPRKDPMARPQICGHQLNCRNIFMLYLNKKKSTITSCLPLQEK